MKKIIVTIGIGFLMVLLVLMVVLIIQYHKPHVDIYSVKTDIAVTIDTLLLDFEKNEKVANKKYLDKIIETEGVIKSIEVNKGSTFLLLSEENNDNNVICYLEEFENKKILSLKTGQRVKVKGICTGYLMDVVLIKSIIIP